MKKMKHLCKRLAVLALLLSVCFGGFLPRVAAQNMKTDLYTDGCVVRTASVVLYYLSADSSRLVPVTRSVELLPGESLLETLVMELGRKPENDDLSSPYPDSAQVELLSAHETRGVATVNLAGNFDVNSINERQFFNLQQAIARTLTEAGAEYVNIFMNGSVYLNNIYSLAYGTFAKKTDDLTSLWIAYQNEQNSDRVSRYVTLYFASEGENFILPEVRRTEFFKQQEETRPGIGAVTAASYEYSSPILSALIGGPQGSGLLPVLLRGTQQLNSYESDKARYVGTAPNRYIIINFSESLKDFVQQTPAMEPVTMASLAYSLTGFIPIGGGANVLVEGEPFYSGSQERTTLKSSEPLLGKQLTLYYPNENGLLTQVQKTVPRGEESLRSYVEALFQAPKDAGAAPVFPEGFSSSDLIGIFQVDNTVVVNVSKQGVALMRRFSLADERAMVYSIVDTLTELSGVKSVQFLCEGQVIESFAGWIDLREPLVRNPGLIQRTKPIGVQP